jgi:hypothetical protein
MANYEAQIHARWAADGVLNGLLPVASLHTGVYMATAPTFPYATLTFPGGSPRTYTSGSTLASPTVRITVYHAMDNHDECKAIMDAVLAAFDRAAFDLTNPASVLNMQLQSEPSQLQDEDGDWYMLADFSCLMLTSSS